MASVSCLLLPSLLNIFKLSTYQRNQEIVHCPVSSPFLSQLLDLQAGSTWLFLGATRGDISKYASLNLEKLGAGGRAKPHGSALYQEKPTRVGRAKLASASCPRPSW